MSVEKNDVEKLRDIWRSAGLPPCAHERLEREVELGEATGYYICLNCGQSGIGPNWPYAPKRGADA